MKSTTIYVETRGYEYGCHLMPNGSIRCGACGHGTVADGRCSRCAAVEVIPAQPLNQVTER